MKKEHSGGWLEFEVPKTSLFAKSILDIQKKRYSTTTLTTNMHKKTPSKPLTALLALYSSPPVQD